MKIIKVHNFVVKWKIYRKSFLKVFLTPGDEMTASGVSYFSGKNFVFLVGRYEQ